MVKECFSIYESDIERCFPISCVNVSDRNFMFFYSDGVKANIRSIILKLKLDIDEICNEYDIEYIGFDTYDIKEEDAKRLVKFINSKVLLNKI